MTCQSRTSNASRLLKVLTLVPLGLCLTLPAGCGSSQPPPKAEPPLAEEPAEPAPPAETPIVEQAPITAREVVANMASAYKEASSYADAGTVRLVAERADMPIDEKVDFSLTLARPDKIRMEVYQAMVVSNGQQLHAAIKDLPNQVLAKEAPQELTMGSVYSDRILASALTRGFAGASPQLLLMLGEDPAEAILAQSQATVLDEPGTIDGHDCYRVKVTRPDGIASLWIDQQSYALRRLVFPVDELFQMLSREGPVENVSLVAEFHDARLGGEIDSAAFQFEVPEGAEMVKFFIPPHPAQLLGKKVRDFTFVDLDGNEVTSASLAGKITVLNCWATWCGPCRIRLPDLDKVWQLYKDHEKVAIFAVSVDKPSTPNQALLDTFDELGVTLPILRNMQQNSDVVFNTTSIPSMFILDAKGVVQHYEVGVIPDLVTRLPEKLNKLLAGEDIYEGLLDAYRERLKEMERQLETGADPNGAQGPGGETVEIPRAEIAARSEPKTIKLSPLWKCTELQSPGNVLVVPSADGPPRLLVVDAWKSIAEVGLDGKVIAIHPLQIEKQEVVSSLRTAVGADGKRYFAAVASAQQRFHLLDENFKRLVSYPQDALENPHSGIADVQLGDLEGDGTLEAFVGYWGVVGLQAVSPEGKRLWSDRSVTNVLRIALAPSALAGPDDREQGRLVCTNTNGSLAVFDAQRKRQDDVIIPGHGLFWVSAEDLEGDGRLQWCGLAAPRQGETVAVGLNLEGRVLWTYSLPIGAQPKPIEQVVAGRLHAEGPGQWLLPAPDGSIHILAAAGNPLDQFNYGAALSGLATVEIDGRPVLLVSSTEGLEAWTVDSSKETVPTSKQ